jgi:glycosyltransferase involved in cell wall biosynthesis
VSVDLPPVDSVVVDVGIPTHGRPVYLGEAIESVLAQTDPPLEVVVCVT